MNILKSFGRKYVSIDEDASTISFKMQNGLISEVGENGCFVDTILDVARLLLVEFNVQIFSDEIDMAINRIEWALHYLNQCNEIKKEWLCILY